MDCFDRLIGNKEQIAYFRRLISSGKCSHAYLFEAPTGGGKKRMAYLLAEALAMKTEGAGEEALEKCHRIAQGNSPDVRILRREEGKKTIGVDAIRDFLSAVYLTPSELSFQFYIFDEADRITPQAQNALLKILEEPPHDVYLVLLCENSRSLLTTVRSRVQKIVLQTFGEEELRAYALSEGLASPNDTEKLSYAVRSANGTIGGLTALLREGNDAFSSYLTAKKIVDMQCRHAGYAAFLRCVMDYITTKDKFDAVTASLLLAYRDLMRARYCETYIPVFFDEDELLRLSMSVAADTVIRSAEAVSTVKNDSAFNISPALLGAGMAVALWRA